MSYLDPNLYLSKQGLPYQPANCRISYLTLPVLEFLKGRAIDETIIACVHSLRPSEIRITDDGILLDHRAWRVTIFAKKIAQIFFVEKIQQEVEVALPDGIENGAHLHLILGPIHKTTGPSPQPKTCKWTQNRSDEIDTECDRIWRFTYGCPFKIPDFCEFCGGKIVI